MARYQVHHVIERHCDGSLAGVRAHFRDVAAIAAAMGPELDRWERAEEGAILFRFKPVDEGVTRFVGEMACVWAQDALGAVTWRSVGVGTLWWSGSMRCTREGDGRIRVTVDERRGVDLFVPAPLDTTLATAIEGNLRAEGERWLDAMVASLPEE